MDRESRELDREILRFMRRHGNDNAPEREFDTLALRLFGFQFGRNAAYRAYCGQEGKRPGSVRSWKEIPAMPALGFKELILSTFPVRSKIALFQTSGTTGGPKGAHFFDTLSLYDAAIPPPFRAALLPDGAKLAYYFLIAPFSEAPRSSLSYMMKKVNSVFAGNRGRFYVKKGKPRYGDLIRDLRKEKKKIMLLTTSFALAGLLQRLDGPGQKLALPPGSRIMETGGFKGLRLKLSQAELIRRCGSRLGVPAEYCVAEYGMTELTSQFYDTKLRNKLTRLRKSSCKKGPSWLKTLVIDPRSGREAAPGRAGILRHVDLANRGSVAAVQTEDLGRRVEDGFELLGRAPGSDFRGCSLNYERFIRRRS